MNRYLKKLANMADQKSRLILGLMSGTSLDGLDIALCRISGSGVQTKLSIEYFETFGYSPDYKDAVKSVFSKRDADIQKVTVLNTVTASLHARLILDALARWKVNPGEIDCIASHGQTIYHAPARFHGIAGYPNATLQIGDGDHIAVQTGIITISDFRQKHIAAGGEGAPLALYGDHILFSSECENRVLLNIGGISNFTFLPAGGRGKVMCSDLGPGNTLIDALAMKYFNSPYDSGGGLARGGEVDKSLLHELLSHPFFNEDLPKTTGPELFNLNYLEDCMLRSGTTGLSPYDMLATASSLTAYAIAKGIEKALGDLHYKVYISGGGCHNVFLFEKIQELLPAIDIKPLKELGTDPDAKEAALFAILANETICGSAVDTGGGPAVTMGKISLPA